MRAGPRKDALMRGELRYTTGKPCKRGHIGERNSIGGQCVACLRERDRNPSGEKRLYWINYQRHVKNNLPKPTRECPQVCECCNRPPGKRALHLDHCHVTGVFRGWICHRCNLGIGQLGDNIAGLRRAISYLENGVQ